MPNRQVIWGEMESPVGLLLFAATDYGLCHLSFQGSQIRERVLEDLKRWLSRWITRPIHLTKDEQRIRPYMQQVEDYFSKKRTTFDLPLDLYGTSFQKKVWNQLQKIPYGEVCSYKQLAKSIGNPRAVRAVGGANRQNPIAIVLPCHRVIGKDGSLVGYGGGLNRKRYLLIHEGWNQSDLIEDKG